MTRAAAHSTPPPPPTTPIELRAAELFRDALHGRRVFADRLMARLLMIQWVGAVAAALIISPQTWIGSTSSVHIHVWAAIILGALLAIFPVLLTKVSPGSALTRQCIAVAQVGFSTLLIHVMGGRIETHFHVFGSLAFLAFYLDWRVLATATAVVAADHFIRGVWFPRSVFGVLTASHWRWLEHAAWVVFEDIVLFLYIHRGVRDTKVLAENQAFLEANKSIIEDQVIERTHQLEQARFEAEAANQAKSDFLANMSHEIRTPMTAIVGYADLLNEPSLSEEDRNEYIATIRSNGEHLVTLINDLLDLSRIEAGAFKLATEPCNIRQLVGDVAAMMAGRARVKNLDLRLDFRYPLPETISCDVLRVRQVLVNLIGNAIKFTITGGITIVVRADHPDRCHASLAIEVIDTGIGIPPEAISQLFLPFFQVDSSGTRRFGGSGLGLAISRRLAEMLGGDLRVQSVLNRGSTFTLELPLVAPEGVRMLDAAPEDSASSDLRPRTPAPAAVPPGLLKNIRILLAEDGPDNQRLISHHLRKAGADVTIVDNGQLALEHALHADHLGNPYGVIFMDMQMPVCDGYTATRRLREAGYARSILALTAHAMTGDRDKCLAAGCDDYLTKPINAALLVDKALQFAERRHEAQSFHSAPA